MFSAMAHRKNRTSLHRTLFVDDSRSRLDFLLSDTPGLRVVGRASRGREALTQVTRLRPDLVVMDFALPDMNVLDAIRRIKVGRHAPRVIVLLAHNQPELRAAAQKAGADGCVTRRTAAAEVSRLLNRPSVDPNRQGRSRGRGNQNAAWLHAALTLAMVVIALATVVGSGFTSWHYWQEEKRVEQRERQHVRERLEEWQRASKKVQPDQSWLGTESLAAR